MKTPTIKLTLEEGGLLLKALGARPFKEVFDLIGRINETANVAISNADEHDDDTTETSFNFTRNDLDLLIRALAELPFDQVHRLMAKLHTQLLAQGIDKKHSETQA